MRRLDGDGTDWVAVLPLPSPSVAVRESSTGARRPVAYRTSVTMAVAGLPRPREKPFSGKAGLQGGLPLNVILRFF